VIFKLRYDKNEKGFLQFINLIEDGDYVLDIGANIGVMTYYYSRMLPNSGVHSFEPIPDNLNVLKRIVRKYKLLNVKVYPYALGKNNEKIKMVMPENNKVYFHGLSHVKSVNKETNGRHYEVEMKRLDDIQDIKDIKVKAIKIDVEEYEFNVLQGARNIINENRPILYCELWDSENREKSIDFIGKLNYKIFISEGRNLKEYKNQRDYRNFFFIPNEYCSKLKLS
jgi:FkbM family methyltransferase